MIRQVFFLFPVLFVVSVPAQDSLQIVGTGGDSPVHSLTGITRITFTDTSMVLGGVNRTYPISGVRKMVFKTSLPVTAKPTRILSTPVNPIRIHQTAGAILIRADFAVGSDVSVRICDMSGRRLHIPARALQSKGTNTMRIGLEEIAGGRPANGIYAVSVSVGTGITSKHTINILH